MKAAGVPRYLRGLLSLNFSLILSLNFSLILSKSL